MKFFSLRGEYVPCGMFNIFHFIIFVLCLLLICLGVYISKNFDEERIYKSIRILAIVITSLEVIKILYNLFNSYFQLDFWFPLSFCSLFIYSLWMTGYGKGLVKEIGEAYITCGSFVAGLSYLIMPTTSLTVFPIFHFQTFYSFFFHSIMVLYGIIYIFKIKYKINKRVLFTYTYFILFFSIIALINNVLFNVNLMFLNHPYNLPFTFVYIIADFSRILYSFLTIVVYIVIPFIVSLFLQRIYLFLKTQKVKRTI